MTLPDVTMIRISTQKPLGTRSFLVENLPKIRRHVHFDKHTRLHEVQGRHGHADLNNTIAGPKTNAREELMVSNVSS
jgi:hypothetical protein